MDEAVTGPLMGAYSPAVAKWDEAQTLQRYGAIMSVARALPLQMASLMPFVSRAQAKDDLLALHRTAGFLVFTRDSGEGGRVTLGPEVRAYCTTSCTVQLLLTCMRYERPTWQPARAPYCCP